MMISIYRALYRFCKLLILAFKPWADAKLKAWVSLRRSSPPSRSIQNQNQKNIWFHASSGEIEYVKSLIIHIKEQNPEINIFVTYSSPSAEKLFANIKPYVTQFLPLPWDQPAPLQKLIQLINPAALVFSRTDFWPELIYQANLTNIPIYIASYYGQMTWLRKQVAKWLFKKAKYISCVDENSAAQLKSILPKSVSISVDGDTRFDQVFWRLGQIPKVFITAKQPIFICGSTWPADEAPLFLMFDHLIQKNYQIILSPHEIDAAKVSRLTNLIKKQGSSLQVLSQQNKAHIDFNANFLLVDEIGYLADLYRFANIAFVGGSFKAKVHSVMEPLCCGLPILLGPHFSNNPEAKKYVAHENPRVIYICHSASELLAAVEEIENAGLPQLKPQIKSLMERNLNASEKMQIKLLNIFPKT